MPIHYVSTNICLGARRSYVLHGAIPHFMAGPGQVRVRTGLPGWAFSLRYDVPPGWTVKETTGSNGQPLQYAVYSG